VSANPRYGRKRTLVLALAVVLVAGLLWGLGSALAGSESPSPAAGKTILRLGWTNDPDNLNPFIGYESSSYEVWAINYDLLVGFRASDMTNQPGVGLATKWVVSPDGKVWTFTITDKAKWQDGQPLTAADVAFTYNYVLKNKLSMFIDYLGFITKVEAPNPTTVVFTCSKPKANMLGLWIPILPEHIWSKIKPADAEGTFKNPPPIVGSGPFQTVEWKKGEFVRMVANKSYWKGAPKIDEVIFQTYQNSDTMAQDLKSGNLQSAWNIPSAQFTQLGNEPDLTAIKCVTAGFDELAFNCADQQKYPKSKGNVVLTDPKFRQALQWAVDKEKIASIGYHGFARPGSTIVMDDYYSPEADYHWTPPAGVAYTFDLEKAKAALDAAGYKDTNGDGIRDYKGKPITLRLYARAESAESQACGKLITGWFDSIGLKINFQVIDDGALGDKLINKEGNQFAPDYDMFIWGWGGDVDPNFILSIFTTNQVGNWSDCAWSNPEYDKLFLQQETTIDVQKRIDLVHQMQQIVYQDTPYIVLAYPYDLEAYNDTQWAGWVRANNNKGGVWYNTQPDTYLAVHEVAPETASSGSRTALIAGIVAAIAIVIIIIVLLVRRRGAQSEMEG
jgi:peptide/nickel transport system substrate-binding protein